MLSIITPVYNEEDIIEYFLTDLVQAIHDPEYINEIILVDGSSSDTSYSKINGWVKQYTGPLKFIIVQTAKSRALQQNKGIQYATGTILYFLFVDCMPPGGFEKTITTHYKKYKKGGVCQFSFSPGNTITRLGDKLYNHNFFYWCRFGDSGIIIAKDKFIEYGLFDETKRIEEDHDLIMQMYKDQNFMIYPIKLAVSQRTCTRNGFIKTYCVYRLVHILYLLGVKESILLYFIKHIKGAKP